MGSQGYTRDGGPNHYVGRAARDRLLLGGVGLVPIAVLSGQDDGKIL